MKRRSSIKGELADVRGRTTARRSTISFGWMIGAARTGVNAVDLIKIDIDGNEFEAFAGGRCCCRAAGLYRHGSCLATFRQDDRIRSRAEMLGYRFWDAKTSDEYSDVADIAGSFRKVTAG